MNEVNTLKILCFGDSNTYGYDPRGFWGGRYDAADRWPDLLEKRTGRKIVNLGANGREIPRNPYALQLLNEYTPEDILLVMLGTNDLLNGKSAPEAAALIEAFLMFLLPHCPHIFLIAPPPMKRGAWVPRSELVMESNQLAEEYRLLARRLGIPFADTRNWHIALTFDGVHFTEEGHRTFAERLATEPGFHRITSGFC